MAKRSENRSQLNEGILQAAFGQMDGIELVRNGVIRGAKEGIPVKRPGRYRKQQDNES